MLGSVYKLVPHSEIARRAEKTHGHGRASRFPPVKAGVMPKVKTGMTASARDQAKHDPIGGKVE